jgi:uncharacterized protein (DUF1015 family)
MVDITPFAALRFDPDKVGDLSKVIAPPYDVINPEMQAALYAKHPNNIVRVDLTKAESGEPEDAKYGRAKETLAAWMKDGVLARDDSPAFYVLAQTFTGPDGVERTRTGFFCRAKLTPFDQGPILPHERTLKGPKIDRLKLMRATHQNLSPIFCVYRDPHKDVLAVLEEAKAEKPAVVAEMDHVVNRMWRVPITDRQQKIQNALANAFFYIADGHHRYETGLAYREERHQEGAARAGGEPPAYDSILTFASAVEDPGMVIFPTHRLAHSLTHFEEQKLFQELDPFFERMESPEAVDKAQAALRELGRGGNAFLMVTKKGRTLLRAKETAPWDKVPSLPQHIALRTLDVAILHSVILEHALHISPEAQASQANLRYSKDFAEAMSAPAREESVQVAFLMNPTKIEEVLNVAESHEVMPQKSTFFYPKIPSGLVLCPLD